MGSSLRHHGRVTVNYLVLMALGGSIATVGLLSEPATQAVSFVAASVIAPGFEATAKIPLGVTLRSRRLARQGLASMAAGYAALTLAAALTFLALRAAGAAPIEDLLNNPGVEQIAGPLAHQVLRSALAAAAGMIIVAAYRHTLLAGALMAMELIPAAALVGAGAAAGRPWLMAEGLERLALDVVLIVVLGLLVLSAKQATVHRRAPMV